MDAAIVAALITSIAGIVVSVVGASRMQRLLSAIEKVTAALSQTDTGSVAYNGLELLRDELLRRVLDATFRGWVSPSIAYIAAIIVFQSSIVATGGGVWMRVNDGDRVVSAILIPVGLGALVLGLLILIYALVRSRSRNTPRHRRRIARYEAVRSKLET